ncbi:Pycsar system effector family protein [Parachryseolinea silvisoli]|uniref:Pycsar system effector family protein n=1 Tax=Parachryseolinea silvisoli TaxID=2873601 RepID=UPI00226582B2|nr:Pycsar system effector family protein [Parachryseolinea silvisoli]MCD9015482.1 DUF5706 domain-containing protein [Parachryseolinea silvisoli]
MEDRLKYIFANVNEWLRFAEAKNGVLVAFNGAAIWGTFQSFGAICELHPNAHVGLWIFICASTIAIIISLFSFMPALSLPKKEQPPQAPDKVNEYSLVYFHHIGQFNHIDYLKNVYCRTAAKQPEIFPDFELDLAHQIVLNSRTAWRKYKYFEISLCVTLIGMIFPVPILIFRAFSKWNEQ